MPTRAQLLAHQRHRDLEAPASNPVFPALVLCVRVGFSFFALLSLVARWHARW